MAQSSWPFSVSSQVHYFRACGKGDLRRRAGGLDLALIDNYRPVLLNRAAGSVDNSDMRQSDYILNPAHADFARLGIANPEPFRFEERLLERLVGIR